MSYQPRERLRRSALDWLGRLKRSDQIGAPPPVVQDRFLDGIPGLLAWSSMLLVVIGAIYVPWTVFSVAAVIGAYMAGRIALAGLSNLVGIRRIRQWENTDWRAEYERRRTSQSIAFEDVRHIVIIPNYKEDLRVLRHTLTRFAASPIARTQVIVVLAMEASDLYAVDTANILRGEFKNCFFQLITTLHPKGLPGEIAGKSANEAWAAHQVKKHLIDEAETPLNIDHCIITISDADSLVHPKFLECLTCLFATSPRPHHSLWQAPIRYHGNVWDINPTLSLVQAYSASWELAYLAGEWWHGMPISTYSLSLRLVDSVGYWDTDVIAEDWHMFIKCYFQRRGNFDLMPVYLPFSGYAVTGNGFLDACKNRYSQTLRHAWGAKEIGYTLKQMGAKPIRFTRAIRMLLRVAHDNLMAGAGWVIMTFGTQLPLLLKPELVQDGLWSPQFIMLQTSLIVVALMGFLFWSVDMRLRPPRPRRWSFRELFFTVLSFICLPVLVLILVAIPAIEAQTRLMLGISLDYQVARKV